MVGTTAIICMPTDAPALKVEATRGYGAEIVFYDRLKDDRAAVARRLVDETGRVLVPPYDDPAIMAGQGTAALELFQDVPSLDAIVTPVGGGGLMAGCSTVARSLSPGITIVGVEADTANDTYLSLKKGERVTIPPPSTIADGIRPQSPGELTFPILRENLSEVALVSDDEIVAAVRFLALRVRVIAEPTGRGRRRRGAAREARPRRASRGGALRRERRSRTADRDSAGPLSRTLSDCGRPESPRRPAVRAARASARADTSVAG